MEASKKFESVADRLAAIERQYPQDKHIWVNAPPRTLEVWPENYGLSHTPFKVPTEYMVTRKGKPGKPDSRENGWIYESYGKWAFLKATKLRIMNDAGIRPVNGTWLRLKEPSKPRFWGLEGTMGRLTINGTLYTHGEKWVSLDDGDFPVESLQTKLELWLGWKLVALPQSFTMEELKEKTFVTFCIYPDPKPKNEAEHMLMLKHFLGIYEPAYPGAALPEGAQRKALPVPEGEVIEVQPAADDDADFVDADDPEPAQSQETSPVGEDTAKAAIEPPAQLPLVEPPLPTGSSKITSEKIDFLQAVKPLKDELLNLLGALKGSEEYYKLMLATTGCQHANQIPAGEKQGTFYRKLKRMVELVGENPKAQEPVKPFAEALEMARPGYAKLSIEKLVERIEAQMELQQYPTDQDPLEIIPTLQEGDKAKCVEAAVRLMERGLIETTKMREQQASDPRGGGRK